MFYIKETALGKIGIEATEESITRVCLNPDSLVNESKKDDETLAKWPFLIKEAFLQLGEYLNGRRREFTLPLEPTGTEFMCRVWEELRRIPFGKTVSYKDIACAIGNEKACRAVGMANNRNPIALFIPCHRVIGANGSLVGYAEGLEMKRRLLDLEKAVLACEG